MRTWSNEQLSAVHLRFLPNRNVLMFGGTGSGKSSAGIYGFLLYSLQYRGKVFGLVAKSFRQVSEVLIRNLRQSCAELVLPFAKTSRFSYRAGPNIFSCFSGKDESSIAQIQGMDMVGIFVDEANNMPENMMGMIGTRIGREVEGGKLVMTGNPKSTLYWFQRKWIDRAAERDMAVIHLTPYHNPSLSNDFIASLENERGHLRTRYLHGLPADPTGLVWEDYMVVPPRENKDALKWNISVDPADSSRTHALLIGLFPDGTWVVAREYVHDFEKDGFKSHKRQAQEITRHLLLDHNILCNGAVCDSNNQSFRHALSKELGLTVANAKKQKLVGIRWMQHALASGKVRISNTCKELRSEISTWRWDENLAGKGMDAPVKHHDHGCDALWYWGMYKKNRGQLNVISAEHNQPIRV